MDKSIKFWEALKFGFKNYFNNLGLVLFLTILSISISFLTYFSKFYNIQSNSYLISFILAIFSILLAFFTSFAFIKIGIDKLIHKKLVIKEFFSLKFLTFITCSFIVGLFFIFYIVLAIAIGAMLFFLFKFNSILLFISLLLYGLLAISLFLYLMLSFYFVPYIIVDSRENISLWQALEMSKNLVKGYRLRLFFTIILFGILLIVLLACIGFLVGFIVYQLNLFNNSFKLISFTFVQISSTVIMVLTFDYIYNNLYLRYKEKKQEEIEKIEA